MATGLNILTQFTACTTYPPSEMKFDVADSALILILVQPPTRSMSLCHQQVPQLWLQLRQSLPIVTAESVLCSRPHHFAWRGSLSSLPPSTVSVTWVWRGSFTVPMLLIGRFIVGIGIGIANVACSTYIAETGDLACSTFGLIIGIPTQRAILTATFNNSYWVGALMAGSITFAMKDVPNNWAWRIPSMVFLVSARADRNQVQAVPAFLSILCLPYIPESPRWLFYQGRGAEVFNIQSRY